MTRHVETHGVLRLATNQRNRAVTQVEEMPSGELADSYVVDDHARHPVELETDTDRRHVPVTEPIDVGPTQRHIDQDHATSSRRK
ncbi:MAG: hypothetical protein R2710_15890 [Acidimicrobiales bacterium]